MSFLDSKNERKCETSGCWQTLWNPAIRWEKRMFAGLQIFCGWVSVLVIGVLGAQIALAWYGISFPVWAARTENVLLAATVGYLTNYVAIEMLFKPYRREPFHPFSILTCGYWKQGLVPKNKDRIGREAGQQIEERLLDPQIIANELCEMVGTLVHDQTVIQRFRDGVKNILREQEQRILEFLLPQIEVSLETTVNENITPEKARQFWAEEIEPRLQSEDVRKLIARNIVQGLQKRSPELMDFLRAEVQKYVYDAVERVNPFGIGSAKIAELVVAMISWDLVEERISQKLHEPKTQEMIQKELLLQLTNLQQYLRSPEAQTKLTRWVEDAKEKLRQFLHQYLRETLPKLAAKALESEDLWNWVEKTLLPSAEPHIRTFLQQEGKDRIIAQLNLSERVAQAIEKQDISEFHQMVQSVASEHLGAIQVLGFLLGGLIGGVQLWLTFLT